VFIGVAWLLGGWKYSPLRFHHWLLLGLGAGTVIIVLGAVVSVKPLGD